MRRLAFIAATLLILPLHGFAAEIRVTTWNLQWFPSGSPNLAPPEIEAGKIQEVAATLRKINPDVILLQEIRDVETCEALVTALKPENYFIAICSQFRDEFGGGLGRQQVAILSKKPTFAASSDRWKSFGTVDPPRGYSFAVIQYGKNEIGFYCVHLKSNLTRGNPERQAQLNILKRELAAEQILEHARTIGISLTNELEAVIVGGDFNTNLDQDLFISEKTLRVFSAAGFFSGFENTALPQRVTIPTKGRYPDATFDYIFAKGVPADAPQIYTSTLSDHHAVTRAIRLP